MMVRSGNPALRLGTLTSAVLLREGRSLNADAVEKCSAKVLIPGRQRKPDDCRTDTFVTSALCQN